MWWRRRERHFEVLGQRFVLPELRLGRHLERAAKARRRLGATWLERLTDPLVRPFRSAEARVQIGFLRAHRVLSAHEEVVWVALDHVGTYDDALARATRHVTERAKDKVDTLLQRAAERRRIAERAAHAASRVESQLERDLGLFAERIRTVAKAAHLMLVRLGRYRGFVESTMGALVEREAQLGAQRALLVHDEHAWHIDRELAADRDFVRWMSGPDAICAGIEETLRGLVKDLDGLETHLVAVPDAVDKLLAQAELADPGRLEDPLAGLEDLRLERLPTLSDVPVRLDDEDWDALGHHELESEVVFGATSVEALGVEVQAWLAARETPKGPRARRCATCRNTIASRAQLGRAHVLCGVCRERAAEDPEWLARVGFAPVPWGAGHATGPITRAVFESVMGWVPSAGPADGPVTHVTWHEAVAFCNALSAREGRPDAYKIGASSTRWVGEGDAPSGWRLPDAPPDDRRPGLREWLWGKADGGGATRRIGPGLRPIAGAHETERATAEVREEDLGFRVIADRDAPVVVEAPADTSPRRTSKPARSQVRAVKPATRSRPLSAAARKRRAQAIGLSLLVAGAGAAIAADQAGVFGERTRAVGVDPSPITSPSPSPSPITSPSPSPITSPSLSPSPSPSPTPSATESDLDVLRAFSARASKDRKAARELFERALAAAPDNHTARYEAAREAAFAKDAATALTHLEALGAIRDHDARARELLVQAKTEPDFARLTRDARWKRLMTPAPK